MKKTTGFTLIELLVVISIISLLSSIMLASLSTARLKARQVRRLSDMRQIFTALQLYYTNSGSYPAPTSGNGSWEESYEDGGQFLETLVSNGFLPRPIVDPKNSTSYRYAYYRYSAGSHGCASASGSYFVLGVRDINENGSYNAYPGSPGWSCPSRNWQSEFDWVMGRFEK